MEGVSIETAVTMVVLPPGTLGPREVTFAVSSFVVVGRSGVGLVDTATPGSTDSIEQALVRAGATWADVADVVLTHRHFDHTGGLSEVTRRAPHATVWAGADDIADIPTPGDRHVRAVVDGQKIGELRVITTPGHTPGHISLLHEGSSSVLIGDLVGSAEGAPTFGPASFTADAAANARSLRRVLDLNPARFLFSHGRELANAADAIGALLED